jgi:hypothetical protein
MINLAKGPTSHTRSAKTAYELSETWIMALNISILFRGVGIFSDRVRILLEGTWLYISKCRCHQHKENNSSNKNLHCNSWCNNIMSLEMWISSNSLFVERVVLLLSIDRWIHYLYKGSFFIVTCYVIRKVFTQIGSVIHMLHVVSLCTVLI